MYEKVEFVFYELFIHTPSILRIFSIGSRAMGMRRLTGGLDAAKLTGAKTVRGEGRSLENCAG